METTREQWLIDASKPLAEWLGNAGYKMPANFRVSCGFPSKLAMSAKKRRIGECWDKSCSGDTTFEILISPCLDNPIEVLSTLLHEMIHAAVGLDCGHKGPFRACAKAMGLEGKMTATVPSDELSKRLHALQLPAYPHAKLEGRNNGPKKQGIRMIKLVCPCGCVARMAQKWIDAGLPTCACGEEFTIEGDNV